MWRVGRAEQTCQRSSLSRGTDIRKGIFKFEKRKESLRVCRIEGKKEGGADDKEVSSVQVCKILEKVLCSGLRLTESY